MTGLKQKRFDLRKVMAVMSISKAIRRVERLRTKEPLSEEEEFEYTETLSYLIEETKNSDFMVELGGFYYERRIFDKALKYYEMAFECGNEWVSEGLGYIWYYGRTGETDYEKAFRYYSIAAKNGNLRSKIKLADMYKNGYYVEKDYQKYCQIIEESKALVDNAYYLNEPLPEIYTRLARIRKDQGRTDEAAELYLEAKSFLAQRIRVTHFFGDRNIMKWLIEDLYTIICFDETDFDLYDLYYVLKKPVTVVFRHENRKYQIQSEDTEDGMAVRFENTWFRTIDDFFGKAMINKVLLTDLYRELYAFEVER